MTMEPKSPARPPIVAAKRTVIKVGTRVLTNPDGRLSLPRLFRVVEAAATLRANGREVLLVSSGAVGLGLNALGLDATPTTLAERQACAAVGQSRLMGLYQDGFHQLGGACAQVLLTQGDFEDRVRYLNLRRALTTLLARGVVPVINENDVVSTDELEVGATGDRAVFGDNDLLSALVATKLGADLLVVLTDVGGVFDRDPRTRDDAKLVDRVDAADTLDELAVGGGSQAGRGGMRSKVRAASMAARAGCHVVIASGIDPEALTGLLAGAEVGTWFPARGALSARRRWIAFATRTNGTLHLDAGAVKALIGRGASLLAAGVTAVEGDFHEGEVVEIKGPGGEAIGRGLIEVDGAAARAWIEGSAPVGVRNRDALVHRDSLVLEESLEETSEESLEESPEETTEETTEEIPEEIP